MSQSAEQPKILIVEDEGELAKLYRQFFEPSYDVRCASTGVSAFEQLDFQPHVVLVDRGLPDMSGQEVVEQIRSRSIGSKIAMVTGSEPESNIHETGIDDYLIKPVEEGEMLEAVENLLVTEGLQDKKRELSDLKVRRNVLELEENLEELEADENYSRLEVRINRLKADIKDFDKDPGIAVK